MNILVTGSTGFIGSHLILRLVNHGFNISVILRNKNSKAQFPKGVSVFYHDGSTQSIVSVFKSKSFDVVIHLASHFLASHETKDIDVLIQSNVLFGTQLLQAMLECGVTKLINVGTVWQNYRNEFYNPVCLYAATKEAFMAIARYYTELHNFSILNLKLADTYGKNDPRGKIIYILKNAADLDQVLEMSHGEQFTDLVHIDDVCNAFIVAIGRVQNSQSGMIEEFQITSEKAMKLKDLVLVFEKVIERPIKTKFGARPYRNREAMIPFDLHKPLPGWRAEIDIESGIRSLYI